MPALPCLNKLILFLLVFVIPLCHAKYDESLRDALVTMKKHDQELRNQLIRVGIDNASKELMSDMIDADEYHTR